MLCVEYMRISVFCPSIDPERPRQLSYAVLIVHKVYRSGCLGVHCMQNCKLISSNMAYLIFTSPNAGLNSKVLANDNEMVICPVNEPTFGTPRKSQIQTYLEQNEGAGLQHLAIKTHDIFTTMRQLRARSHQAGFDFMPRASDAYYR